MKILLILLITILAAGLFSGQSQAGETMMGKEASGMMESTAYTAEQLIGLNVDSLEGKHVGKIRDVNLNSETGEINYVILGKSLLGIGEDKFAMPLEALKIENDEGSANATLVVSEFKVITAPSFEDTKSDQEFKDILLNHYCEAPEFEKGIDGPKRC